MAQKCRFSQAQAWLTRVTFVDLVHGAKYGGGEGERAATCLTDLLAHTHASLVFVI